MLNYAKRLMNHFRAQGGVQFKTFDRDVTTDDILEGLLGRETYPYGVCPDTETWIPIPNGGVFAFPNAESSPDGCDYVRVLDSNGGEIAYWSSSEWEEEPEEVMGAICGAISSEWEGRIFYQFGPKTIFPEGVEYNPYPE